ncbi:response regulator transcription factor, partial [Nocardia wallacei]|uniref:response regulator transcription factor n=1 Tax=Nocardia wallacei TaxID=480035 RepID=UPI0024585144
SEIVNRVVLGRTNRQISQELYVSEKTVEAHLTRLYTKFGISSRAEVPARYGPGGPSPEPGRGGFSLPRGAPATRARHRPPRGSGDRADGGPTGGLGGVHSRRRRGPRQGQRPRCNAHHNSRMSDWLAMWLACPEARGANIVSSDS